MHAASSASAQEPPTSMPKYSKGALRAKVESLESSLLFLRGRLRDVPEGVASVEQLLARLARAKACLIRDGRMLHRSRDSSLFWMHVHEVAADMLPISSSSSPPSEPSLRSCSTCWPSRRSSS